MLTNANILLIDSDSTLRCSLREWLMPQGCKLSNAATAREALAQLNLRNFDLIILAKHLTDCDGLRVCREICRTSRTPILMVSETGSDLDEVAGLEAGADAFLVKPLGPDVTVARVRSLVRRSKRNSN